MKSGKAQRLLYLVVTTAVLVSACANSAENDVEPSEASSQPRDDQTPNVEDVSEPSDTERYTASIELDGGDDEIENADYAPGDPELLGQEDSDAAPDFRKHKRGLGYLWSRFVTFLKKVRGDKEDVRHARTQLAGAELHHNAVAIAAWHARLLAEEGVLVRDQMRCQVAARDVEERLLELHNTTAEEFAQYIQAQTAILVECNSSR